MSWRNNTGRPLSGSSWLLDHHLAKLSERTAFAKQTLNAQTPKVVVDLGCGTGLWLDIFANLLPEDTHIVGIDTDAAALAEARTRSSSWTQRSDFICADLSDPRNYPSDGDLYLAFNVIGYLRQPSALFESVQDHMVNGGRFAVRQYDGAALRFGPLRPEQRLSIDASLFSATRASAEFRHYDMDRVYQAICNSAFSRKHIELETFKAQTPYSAHHRKYLQNTLKWTEDLVGDNNKEILKAWASRYLAHESDDQSYFYEVDLVAVMS